jgi:hypothetical protein
VCAWRSILAVAGIYQKFGGCGFREDHAVNVYSSPDLVNWTFRGNALPVSARPGGIYFRPKVLFNERTGQYVLWVNFLRHGSDDETPLRAYPNATYLVATSGSPIGPFRVVREKASVAWSGAGDITLFIDSADQNRTAYVAYDAWSNGHRISIEKLTDDYTDSVGSSSSGGELTPSGQEAPIVFWRNSVWYLLYGATCCFCVEGSGSVVLTAPHPLGPWNYSRVDLNPKSSIIGARPIAAQESFVVHIPKSDSYIYVGDRWRSAPDHLKSHDFQCAHSSTITFSTGLCVLVSCACKGVKVQASVHAVCL